MEEELERSSSFDSAKNLCREKYLKEIKEQVVSKIAE